MLVLCVISTGMPSTLLGMRIPVSQPSAIISHHLSTFHSKQTAWVEQEKPQNILHDIAAEADALS